MFEVNSRGRMSVTELKKDQQEQNPRDGAVINMWLPTSLGGEEFLSF